MRGLILINGKIHNMTSDNKRHNLDQDRIGTIVISNNKIIEINYNNDDISKHDLINGYKKKYQDFKIVDITDHDIYPGLIDAHCHHGVMSMHGHNHPNTNEFNGQDNHTLNITDEIDPKCPLIKSARSNGIVAMCVCPGSGQLFGGMCSIIKPIGSNFVDDMVIDDSHIMKCALGENPLLMNSENSQMKLAQIFRSKLQDPSDRIFEKIKNGDMTLKIHCHSAQSIGLAIRLIREFNLNATLDHATESDFMCDEIKELNIPIIAGPLLGARSKNETSHKNFHNLTTLYLKDIEFALSTDTITYTTQDLRLTAILAASESATSKYTALKAITATPAKFLGLDNYGTIELGKSANFVITKGDIMDIYNPITHVYIDGKMTLLY